MTVEFLRVGSDKKTWQCEVRSFSDLVLIEEIRNRDALISREIKFSWNARGDAARILAGGWHHVGDVKVRNGQQSF